MIEHRRHDRSLTVFARFTFVNSDFHNWLEQRFPEFGFVYDADVVYIVLIMPPLVTRKVTSESEIPPPQFFPTTDLFSLWRVASGNPAAKQEWPTSLLLDFACETMAVNKRAP